MRNAQSIGIDHEQADAVGATLDLILFLGTRHHQHLVRGRYSSNPDLLAIEAPAVAICGGKAANLQRVATGIGFSQCHAEVQLAGNQLRQPFLALLFGTEPGNRYAPEDRIDHEQLAQRGAAALLRQRLDNQRHLEHTQTAAAILLRQGHAHQAGIADGLPDLVWEFLAGVELAPIIHAKFTADAARGLDHHFLLFRQCEFHFYSPLNFMRCIRRRPASAMAD